MSELQKLVIVFEELCKNPEITHLNEMQTIDLYRFLIVKKVTELYDNKEKSLKEIQESGFNDENMPF
jgi:hypothetical protein